MPERYDVLLMDPPWSFASTAGGGNRRDVARQYPTMTVAEIRALYLRFAAHVHPIARLFLWVPDSQLEAGFEVMRAWGFAPNKVAFVWVKMARRQLLRDWDERRVRPLRIVGPEALTDKHGPVVLHPDYGARGLAFGAGRTTRNGAELCLLGARGRMAVADRSVRQVILAPQREHSRKPDETYECIEALYPGRRYLELFARHRRPGWAAWGDETPITEGARA